MQDIPARGIDEFFPRLEALRGLAALVVVADHAWQSPWNDPSGGTRSFIRSTAEGVYGGWTTLALSIFGNGLAAVNLFFVISGFVLLQSLVRGPASTTTNTVRFVIARLFRIYPAAIATIGIFLLVFYSTDLTISSPAAYAPLSLLRNAFVDRFFDQRRDVDSETGSDRNSIVHHWIPSVSIPRDQRVGGVACNTTDIGDSKAMDRSRRYTLRFAIAAFLRCWNDRVCNREKRFGAVLPSNCNASGYCRYGWNVVERFAAALWSASAPYRNGLRWVYCRLAGLWQFGNAGEDLRSRDNTVLRTHFLQLLSR